MSGQYLGECGGFRTASQGGELPVTGGIQAEGGWLPLRDAEEGISLIAGRWNR